ncbi:MAG: hypothetical protein LKK13_04715 [Bacilli bacterium]|nr:hypothetical protein [Bacilli bacterium]
MKKIASILLLSAPLFVLSACDPASSLAESSSMQPASSSSAGDSSMQSASSSSSQSQPSLAEEIKSHIDSKASHLASYYVNESNGSSSFYGSIIGQDIDGYDYDKTMTERKTIYDNYVSSSEIASTEVDADSGKTEATENSTELHYYDDEYNYYEVGVDHLNGDSYYGSIVDDDVDQSDLSHYFKDKDFNDLALSLFSDGPYLDAPLKAEGDFESSFTFSFDLETEVSYSDFFDDYDIFPEDDWKIGFSASVSQIATIGVSDGVVSSYVESVVTSFPNSVLTGEAYAEPVVVAASLLSYTDISCQDFGDYSGVYYHTVFFVPASYEGTFKNGEDTLTLDELAGASCSGEYNGNPLACDYFYQQDFLDAYDICCDNGDHHYIVRLNKDGNLDVFDFYSRQETSYFSFDGGETIYRFYAVKDEDGEFQMSDIVRVNAVPEGYALSKSVVYQRG